MTWWRPALAVVACVMAAVVVAWAITTGPKPASTSVGVTAAPSSPAPEADPPKPDLETLVLDDFERAAVTRGLGRARVGGRWKIFAQKADRPDYAVKDGRGIFDLSRPALRRTG
ncbi:MAG TPA: hypothetical protein VLJ88_07350, partial [Propionibacteriaceae bacterium]|nr:hypothetical protein [Propionibacteriaceae bacterium]